MSVTEESLEIIGSHTCLDYPQGFQEFKDRMAKAPLPAVGSVALKDMLAAGEAVFVLVTEVRHLHWNFIAVDDSRRVSFLLSDCHTISPHDTSCFPIPFCLRPLHRNHVVEDASIREHMGSHRGVSPSWCTSHHRWKQIRGQQLGV